MTEASSAQANTVAAFRLSIEQQHLWNLPGDISSRTACCAVSLSGSLDRRALNRALQEVVEQNEILRTVFRRQPGMKVPFQVILEDPNLAWEYVEQSWDEGSDRRAVSNEFFGAGIAHDLENGPVLSALLANITPAHGALFLRLPALCSD